MGKITYETALANAFDPKGLRELVELGAKAKSRFGEATRTYG